MSANESLIRGRLLSFHAEPVGDDGYTYIEDGGLLIRAGRIAAVGAFAEIAEQAPAAPVSDHRPHLILPGFIDPHIHFPQAQAIGAHGAQLLDWLNRYIFVEEQKFADASHAARIASAFFDALIAHGTTTACAFCSVHPASVDAYFAEAQRRGMRMLGGKVLMDRNAPEGLRDTAERGVAESEALIARWHGRGRLTYAISPRFAITSTEAQMAATAALIAAHPDLLVQTHLAENRAEIAHATSLFPQARDYTDIYARYGMLGPRSLMGHCIHLSDREAGALAESGAVAVFCPTSNLFLGSGLFDLARLRAAGVRVAVATDVGAGTSYSLLRTLDEAYKVLQLQGQSLAPLRGFYMATLGNARALGLEGAIGSLSVGAEADLVTLDVRATPAMALRAETVETLAQELFVLQTMGDDRSVAAVHVAGAQVKGAAPDAAHTRRGGASAPDRG
ncbi:MAG: guanine deaminase [Alphaproteobacteria bacterium HGW-Alphaproteobacteria-10]|nr:MAG: guanine deaminase [Alphaproteobacteria bacterium HGW-Alphaproteobacteria-10]